MNDKFKYAPGLPGYGTIGKDGSAGVSGLATYFSEFDGAVDQTTIRARITNNLTLFGTGGPLPGYPERTYQQGDIFIDINARVYEIDFTQSNNYIATGIFLNTSGYFEFLKASQNGYFDRYTNNRTSGTRVLIDAVQAIEGVGDYTLVPTSIYGDVVSNFTTVTHTNIAQGVDQGYNLLSIWKGDLTASNHDALALVKTSNTTEYRLGNLDASENLRNTTLVLDVSAVRISKDKGGDLDNEAPLGSVLTNREINTNFLFDPNFDSNPASFDTSIVGSDAIVISWDKRDFVNTQNLSVLNNIKADLYFYDKRYNTYNGETFDITDVSTIKEFKPFVFADIDASGSILIEGLETAEYYGCYLNFYENGWIRRSINKIFQSGVAATLQISPTSWVTWLSGGEIRVLEVSTNSTWSAYTNPPQSWVNLDPASGPASGATWTPIDVSVSPYTVIDGIRSAFVKVEAGTELKSITITQLGPQSSKINFGTVSYSGTLYDQTGEAVVNRTNHDSGCTYTITFDMRITGDWISSQADFIFIKNSSPINTTTMTLGDTDQSYTFNNILAGDTIEVEVRCYNFDTLPTPDVSTHARISMRDPTTTCTRTVYIQSPSIFTVSIPSA